MASRIFLGADVGSTKTHVLLADESGQALALGVAGPGNHEGVGYEGLAYALQEAASQALQAALVGRDRIAGAGFGVAGFDWPSEKPATLQAIASLGLSCPIEAVNDSLVGLLAGSPAGWGIALVSGTGCNCRGWDQARRKEGMVTGAGWDMGEAAGAGELVRQAVIALSHEWSRRGPPTRLTPLLVECAGASDLSDLLEGLVNGRYILGPWAAPLVFQAAELGDEVALNIIQWATLELAEMAKAVIRQLDFAELDFDLVLVGSVFNAGAVLVDPLKSAVHAFAPGACFIRLEAPPVIGGILLGMQQVGAASPAVHANLVESVSSLVR